MAFEITQVVKFTNPDSSVVNLEKGKIYTIDYKDILSSVYNTVTGKISSISAPEKTITVDSSSLYDADVRTINLKDVHSVLAVI